MSAPHLFTQHTVQQKIVRDLGQLTHATKGSVNVIPTLPGMGMVTQLKNMTHELNAQGIASVIIPIGDRSYIGAMSVKDALAAGCTTDPLTQKAPEVVIMDVGHASLNDQERDDIVQVVRQYSTHASVWVIGSSANVSIFAERMPEETTTFTFMYRPDAPAPKVTAKQVNASF